MINHSQLPLTSCLMDGLLSSGGSPIFKNQELAVVGGGDTACEEALYLTKYAKHVGASGNAPSTITLSTYCPSSPCCTQDCIV